MPPPPLTNPSPTKPQALPPINHLLALASSNPFAFLRLAFPALTNQPEPDPQLLLLTCGVLGKLSLKHPCRLLLDRLPPPLRAQPGAQAIEAALRSLPDDRLSTTSLIAHARENLMTLISRRRSETAGAVRLTNDETLLSRFELWQRSISTVSHHAGPGGALLTLTREGHLHTLIESLPPHAFAPSQTNKPHESIYLAGCNNAEAMLAAHALSAPRALGMRTRLILLETNLDTFFTTLGQRDLHAVLADPLVDILVGDSALAELQSLLHARLHLDLSGIVVGPEPLNRQVDAILQSTLSDQHEQTQQLAGELTLRHDARNDAWYQSRWTTATARASTDPLRILLTTTRYSTFVKHSVSDMANALTSLGHNTRVLIEPDDASRMTTLTLVQTALRFDPDLILCINHLRSAVCGPLLRNVPFACFIQDRMPALFTTHAGLSQDRRDFILGHLHPELFSTFRYPRTNTLMAPVPVCEEKFSAAPSLPTDRATLDRLTCEIAYVSHQSATPESLRDELRAHKPKFIDALYERLQREIAEGLFTLTVHSITDLTQDLLRATVPAAQLPSSEQLAEIVSQTALPMAERFLRQQMLSWASELCRERSWRLHLFGRGWENHPNLAQHAKGPLHHADELPLSYRLARVHLHAGMGGIHHQRPMECALAGGVCAVRIKQHDLDLVDWCTRNEIARDLNTCNHPINQPIHLTDHPLALQLKALHQRLNIHNPADTDDTLHIPQAFRDAPFAEGRCVVPSARGSWLLGDPARHTFWSRETFRNLVIPLVENDQHRASLSAWQRAVTQDIGTHRAIMRQLLQLIRTNITRISESATSVVGAM
ncbi:MAG: hypothetical protein IBJ18_13275 [Phycisphaerales bacterium]|nr:hypothetical protein [Phycisphaerales bacterium]